MAQNAVIEKEDVPEYESVKMFGDKILFIFLIDRSGSMTGDRIKITVEAVKLFV